MSLVSTKRKTIEGYFKIFIQLKDVYIVTPKKKSSMGHYTQRGKPATVTLASHTGAR